MVKVLSAAGVGVGGGGGEGLGDVVTKSVLCKHFQVDGRMGC